MISLTARCIPSQPRPANLIMASSSFPQEKSVAVLIPLPLPWLPGHATWETNSCENIFKTSLNDFRLCWRWWRRDSPFFRGPGRFNDILAIVWHVIVKFLCRTWREHSEPAWRGNSQWLETWKRQSQHTGAHRGRRKKKIIMMEENDLHRSPRGESALELGKNYPLLTVLSQCLIWIILRAALKWKSNIVQR